MYHCSTKYFDTEKKKDLYIDFIFELHVKQCNSSNKILDLYHVKIDTRGNWGKLVLVWKYVMHQLSCMYTVHA